MMMSSHILMIGLLMIFISSSWSLKDTTFQVQPYQIPNAVEYITEQINMAKKHVDLAIYDFSSGKMKDAVETACNNNVTFSMYVDYEENGDPDSDVSDLADSFPDNIQVIYDSWKVHAKFVVIDGRLLLLGSSNWEDDEPDNIEFLMSSADSGLINQVTTQFKNVFPNKWDSPPPPQDEDDKKRAAKKPKSKTQFYFKRGVHEQLLALIKSAKTSIDGALYKLTNQIFYDALKISAAQGVSISLYLNGAENDYEGSYSDLLETTFDDNYKVVYSPEDTKMHCKFVVFDKKIVALGSANWSPGVESNLEDLIVSTDPDLVKQALDSLAILVRENDN